MELKDVRIYQGDFSLREIGLRIDAGQYAVLMGPTGCGKTTLLEAIVGLRRISGGQIILDDCDVTRLGSAARQIGYVPQEGALFPTMRVEQQIGFALEIRGVKKTMRTARVEQLAELLEIENLLNRLPSGLSGGERQRVALARALSFRPRWLCLDEPLSALDQLTRERLTETLRSVHQQESVTVLHVTHQQLEADALATIKFQMLEGRLVCNS